MKKEISKIEVVKKGLRFEIFKRDNFTCQYCGRKSPSVILEVDHIIPKANNGKNNSLNLITSCFDCNRGKSDKNLSEIIIGENPHDKAVELAERERQLKEYDIVRKKAEIRIEKDSDFIFEKYAYDKRAKNAIRYSLKDFSKYDVMEAIRIARERKGDYPEVFIPYFMAILRNWRKQIVKSI